MTKTSILKAGLAFGLLCSLASSALAKTDKEFLADAIKGNNSEVALGQLAADKGGSEGVRAFGQTLAADHGKSNEEASSLAVTMGVTPPTEIKDEAKAEMEKLNGLSGADFDKEFAAYMVKDHEKDIQEYQEEADKGDGETSKLAKKTLPTLNMHLKTAESLAAM